MNRSFQPVVYSLIFLVGMSLSLSTSAQDKELTLEDAILKRYTTYFPDRAKQLSWLPTGSQYASLGEPEGVETLVIKESGTATPLRSIPLSELNEIMASLEVTFEFFPKINWVSNETFVVKQKHVYYEVDISKNSARQLFDVPEDAQEITFNADYTACAFVLNHNLYYQKDDGIRIQITSDGKPGIVYGQAVHRSEFGIHSGLFWAPDNNKLAFYRMDESMVDDYPLVDISIKPASLKSIKYPMAGTNSHHVKLGVFDPALSKTIYMDTGKPLEQYLTSVTWSPASDHVYIALLNRDQNQLKLNRYRVKSGALDKTLFEEDDEFYVEPEHQLWFLPHDKDKFIWWSERSGFMHLYLYDTDGELLKILTTGNWEVEEILGYDDTKNYLFVEGTGEVKVNPKTIDDTHNAMHRFTYLVDVEMGTKSILDATLGTHMAMASEDGKYIIDQVSSTKIPWKATLWSAVGKEVMPISNASDPTKDLKIGKAELMNFSRSEHDLYARVIKPSDFDSTKKYPLLLYVYGGPHAQLVRDIYLASAPLWMYWMAEQGYIVATVDNRGSENRGLEFEQTTFQKLGQAELADQKDFVDYLVSLGYIDKDNMAIHGWSYGGFMTINMMLTYPGLFKAGVAGGPVCDWSMYEVMYTERYMDTPATNPEGYASANLVDKAEYLEDDLLIIHGTVDDVVVWQHSQAFIKACVDSQTQLDYFVYPGHPHNVRGKDRVHLMEKVLDYIDDRIEH